jgi:hypothetical protein
MLALLAILCFVVTTIVNNNINNKRYLTDVSNLTAGDL